MKHKYTRLCGILFILIIAALAGDVLTTRHQRRADGPKVALPSKQKLAVVIDGDTTAVPLAKGDSVRIVGYSQLTNSQNFIVETARGDVGLLDASALPLRQVYVHDGTHKGDTVVALEARRDAWNHPDKYTVTTAAGEKIERVSGKDIAPVGDDIGRYHLGNNASTSVASARALQRMKGRSLAEIERTYGMAYNVLVCGDSTSRADFRIYAYGDDGRLYRPSVTFGPDGRAADFTFVPRTGKADNSLFLGNVVARAVIDMPIIRALTRTNSYTIPTLTGKSLPWYMYLLVPVEIAVYLVWFLATPSAPVLLIGWLIACRRVFYPLGNRTLRAIIVITAVVCTAAWMIALMGWGMHWALTLLVVSASCFSAMWAMKYLGDTIPHDRCPGCRRISTIYYDRREATGTEYVKKIESERGEMLDRDEEHYNTWTEVTTTTTYSDGHTSTKKHRENERRHTRRHDTYMYTDYQVTYLVTHYICYYKCNSCGFEETETGETWEPIDKKYVGQHVGTHSYEV